MLSTLNLIVSLLAFVSLSFACPEVEIIVTSGTEEKYEGVMGSLAHLVAERVPGSAITFTPYEHQADFEASEPTGVTALTKMIKAHNQRCPNGKVVLLGYSQGAQVVMDTICGTRELTFVNTPQLSPRVGRNIAASVVYGDLSRVPGPPYNRGSGHSGGIYPRLEPQLCKPFISRMLSYCVEGDPFCNKGTDLAAHGSYFDLFNNEAANWIVNKVHNHR